MTAGMVDDFFDYRYLGTCSAATLTVKEKHCHELVTRFLQQVYGRGSTRPGSDFARRLVRFDLYAAICKFGNPNLYLTWNPNDIDHPLVAFFAGEAVTLASFRDIDQHIPNRAARAKLLSKDPAAHAKIFHIIISAMFHALLGWEVVGKFSTRYLNIPGIFGDTKCFVGTVEAQRRGSLHLHLLLWLACCPHFEELKKRLKESKEYRDRFQKFMGRIISQHLPRLNTTQQMYVEEKYLNYAYNEQLHKETLQKRMNFKSSENKFLSEEKRKARRIHRVCCYRPPFPTDKDYDIAIFVDQQQLVIACQQHICGFTCYKYGGDCRFEYDFKLGKAIIIETRVLANGTVQWCRPKGSEFINPYNRVILLNLRGNNDIQWMYSGKDINTVCSYICDYVTKEELRTSQVLPILSKVLAGKNTWDIRKDKDPSTEVSRKMMVKLLNQIHSHREKSGAIVCTVCLGYKMSYASHESSRMYLPNFLNAWPGEEGVFEGVSKYGMVALDPGSDDDDGETVDNADNHQDMFDEDRMEEKKAKEKEATMTEEEKKAAKIAKKKADAKKRTVRRRKSKFCTASDYLDYKFRPKAMSGMNVYDFCSSHFKKNIKDSATIPGNARFKKEHPHARSMRIYTFARDRLLSYVGPRFPNQEVQPEEFARYAMILFKPWDNDTKTLKDGHETYLAAFEAFKETDKYKNNKAIADVLRFTQAFRVGQTEKAEEVKAKNAARKASGIAPVIDYRARSRRTLAIHSMTISKEYKKRRRNLKGLYGAPPTTYGEKLEIVSTSGIKNHDAHIKLQMCGQLLTAKKMCKPELVVDNARTFTAEKEKRFKKMHKDLKDASASNREEKCHVTDADPELSEGKKNYGREHKYDNVTEAEAFMQEVETESDVVVDIEFVKGIAREFTLEGEQLDIFMDYGNEFIRKCSGKGTHTQSLAFLTGVAGTGKSRVIGAISKLYEAGNKSSWLRKGSFTNTASNNISGVTVSYMCGDNRGGKSKKDSNERVTTNKDKYKKLFRVG